MLDYIIFNACCFIYQKEETKYTSFTLNIWYALIK